jgi:hypothetical protein
MLRRYCAVIVAGLIAAPAFAGLLIFSSLSPEEARQIKGLAVVSEMGDTVHGRTVGLTIFQNKSFEASLPDWHIDATITKDIVEQIVAGGKIGGEAIAWVPSVKTESEIVREAGAQGFDAVLVVIPEENVHDRSLGSGVTLLHRKLPGLDKVHLCIVGMVRVFRVSDGKRIGASVIEPCSYARNTLVWHDTWEAFSVEEKQAALAALQEQSLERTRKALVELKLRDK